MKQASNNVVATGMEERSGRFGDAGEFVLYQTLALSQSERSFYSGDVGAARMALIRRTIERVRSTWRDHAEVPDFVSRFIGGLRYLPYGITAQTLLDPIAASLAANRDWADRLPERTERPDSGFPLIRLYTNDDGYRTLFASINQMYRSADPATDEASFYAMTWLVELLSMELFAASRKYPDATGRRTVYRGMKLPRRFLEHYRVFADEAISLKDRSVSIPLGFHSTSKQIEKARDFLRYPTPDSVGDDTVDILWKIEIASLTPARRRLYEDVYPAGVISSICATDISAFSAYPESEILLRGPFFDIIDCRRTDPGSPESVWQVDAVMLDSNRDHISTYELGANGDEARTLFNALVTWERSLASAEHAERSGKSNLATRYRDLASQAEARTRPHVATARG